MDLATIFLLVLAVILVVIGFVGLVLPVLPGSLFIFTGLVLAAWAEGFAHVGWITISILALLTVLATAVDFLAGALGAKRFGASKRAIAGAALGATVGIFFGIPGIIIGPFAGAILGELTVKKDFGAAGRAGIGTWLGLLLGVAAKVAIGFTMVGIFILARFL